MHSIENGYKNHKGIYYDNIRNVHYDEKSDMLNNLGTPIAETTFPNNPFFTLSFKLNNGIYLYQTNYDKKQALRLYRDYADYKYFYHDDEKLVSELQKRQKNIKLTNFPTGIISIENYTVGQEVPYYKNYNTIASAIVKNQIKDPIMMYLKILEVLKELENNGILYSDIHSENFMIDITNTTLKLIDFEPGSVLFDNKNKEKYVEMLQRLKRMIEKINKYYGISFKNDFSKSEKLVEIEEYIHNKQYSMLKK